MYAYHYLRYSLANLLHFYYINRADFFCLFIHFKMLFIYNNFKYAWLYFFYTFAVAVYEVSFAVTSKLPEFLSHGHAGSSTYASFAIVSYFVFCHTERKQKRHF